MEDRWKAEATAQISQLQAAVKTLLERQRLPDLFTFDTSNSKTMTASPAESTSESIIAPIDPRDDQPEEQRSHEEGGPGLVQAPMSNLYELTKAASTPHKLPRPSRSDGFPGGDLISRGIVPEPLAQQLLTLWLTRHNRLLFDGAMFPHTTLTSVRRSSPLLSAAVLTIAALHTPNQPAVLQRCYDAFVALIGASSLSRNHSLDDVRALCVAAFFLPNLSWRLSGQATRLAAEMNLHQSFQKLVIGGDARHAERARVWLVLFVCDRQLSIAYGRPSSFSHDDDAVRAVERFAEPGGRPSYVPGDVRIVSHTALFRILSEAYRDYGNDASQLVAEDELGLKLRAFNIALDQWRLTWQGRCLDAPGIGAYPSQSIVLYYHFARFQLNALAFRGLRWPSSDVLGSNRREAAVAAVSAAMSTLVHVAGEPDVRSALCSLPLFTHTMVAFCATFLLKMAVVWARGGDALSRALGLGFNVGEVVSLAGRSADVLEEVAERVSEKHVVRLIVAGIRELLQRVGSGERGEEGDDSLREGLQVRGCSGGVAAVEDFATQQVGGAARDMVYNMDVDSLAALLEYGTDETFLGAGGGEFDWSGLG